MQGMAVTRERKLAIAERSYQLLTEKYGIPAEDIIFDPLVFPCGTGDEKYVGTAVETIEGIRLIKAALPRTKTVLGISNVSFGLPDAGREVLNSVFLYHCVQGRPRSRDRQLGEARALRLDPRGGKASSARICSATGGEDPIAAFAAHFRERKAATEAMSAATLPLDERLATYIIEGTKDGLIADLDASAPRRMARSTIINGPLMAGMDEVGRLFNANELIVAEVLQIGRGDEGRGLAPRAVHGEERDVGARQGAARDGQGRRPRHRQEPRRDHPLANNGYHA